jgi:kynurenine formamidase
MRTTSLFALAVLVFTSHAAAQSWRPPADNQRCPSKWGAADERGSGNHMKPETVLRAARLIKTGEVFELGRVLAEGIPLSAGRRFEIITKRSRQDPGNSSMYNCFKLDDVASRTGFTKLGVQQVGTLMTRGVLIDVAALKKTSVLPDTYEITPQDLQQALSAQKLALQPGDAVLIHTGWGTLWGKDNARYQRTSPGLGTAAAEWLAKQDPMLVGSDNGAVEVTPNPDPQLAGPVHQIFLVVNGIHLLENLRLDELAARQAHEFALVVEPLKIQGGTGSTVAPVAIR